MQVLQPLEKLIHDVLGLGFAYLITCPRSVMNIREKISASTQLEKYMTSFDNYQMKNPDKPESETDMNFLFSSVSYISLMLG